MVPCNVEGLINKAFARCFSLFVLEDRLACEDDGPDRSELPCPAIKLAERKGLLAPTIDARLPAEPGASGGETDAPFGTAGTGGRGILGAELLQCPPAEDEVVVEAKLSLLVMRRRAFDALELARERVPSEPCALRSSLVLGGDAKASEFAVSGVGVANPSRVSCSSCSACRGIVGGFGLGCRLTV